MVGQSPKSLILDEILQLQVASEWRTEFLKLQIHCKQKICSCLWVIIVALFLWYLEDLLSFRSLVSLDFLNAVGIIKVKKTKEIKLEKELKEAAWYWIEAKISGAAYLKSYTTIHPQRYSETGVF